MREAIIQKVLDKKIVAIVRGVYDEDCINLAKALYAGGIELLEVTFDQSKPEALTRTSETIRRLVEELGDKMAFGAGTVTSLEMLELASTPIDDFWPLTNLTNLRDLNLSYTPFYYSARKWGKFGDLTPLYQMTWLDRLWLANSRVGEESRVKLREALPNTELLFFSVSATNCGWRYAPSYYEMRDIIGMFYQYS